MRCKKIQFGITLHEVLHAERRLETPTLKSQEPRDKNRITTFSHSHNHYADNGERERKKEEAKGSERGKIWAQNYGPSRGVKVPFFNLETSFFLVCMHG